MIRFIIKSAIWLSLAFMIMPHFFPAEPDTSATPQTAPASTGAAPDSVDALLANGKTALEIGKLCINNPALCENGASLLSNAASGVLTGSGNVLDYLSDRFGNKQEAQSQDPVIPEAVSQPAALPRQTIPIPTPRAQALRALDQSMTGAIKPANRP